MKKIEKLLDFYKNPRQNGIFFSMGKDTAFSNLFNTLGVTNDDGFHALDFEYMYNRSGLKTVSPMLEQMAAGYIMDDNSDIVHDTMHNRRVTWDYMVTDVDQNIITFVIKTKYLDKWTKLADTLNQDYDMIKPYDMEIDDTASDELKSNQLDETTTHDEGKTSQEQNSSRSGNENRYGFNSTDAVPTNTDTVTTDTDGSGTTSNDGTRNSKSDYERTNETVRTIKRKGNIGNQSAQELIQKQRDMLMYQIFDTIYADLDDILTRSFYH